MTVAPQSTRVAAASPGEAIEALRASGLRLSTPRRLVIEGLFAAPGPVSASDLATKLSLDESSVYRNLEVLERHGLIHHVHLGHGAGLYALVGRDDGEYLYCESCGKVTVLEPSRLEAVRVSIAEEFAHHARFSHFAIVGLCDDCLGKSAASAPRSGHAHPH